MTIEQNKGIHKKNNASSTDNTLAYPNSANTQSDLLAYNFYNASNRTFNSFNPNETMIVNDFQPNANNLYEKSFNSAANGGRKNSVQSQMNEQAKSASNADIRSSVGLINKQVYKQALDQQVAAKASAKQAFETARKKSDIDSLTSYPFGQRTDPSTFKTTLVKIQPTGHPVDYRPSFHEEKTYRFNKDNIVEKPNSLSNDCPPYGKRF